MDTALRTWYIYVLIDPRSEEIRYVGWTINPRQRLSAHVSRARKGGSYKYHWIAQLLDLGLRPTIEIIESGSGDHKDPERRWIAYYRSIGCRLTNLTDGGDGAPGYHPTEEIRRKMSIAHTGRKQTPESTAKTAAALRGRKQSVEHIARLSASRKGHIPTAATEAAAIANRGRKHSPDHIAKRIAPLKGKKRPAMRKLTQEQAQEIREMHGAFTQRAIAKKYGVGVATINEILHNRTYLDSIE